MSNPRPEQLSTSDESLISSGGISPDGSVISAGSDIPNNLNVFIPQLAGGRLTIDNSGFDPVPNVDLATKSNIYYVPYVGTQISLYDGEKWVPHDFFPYISGTNSGLSNDTIYDIFVVSNNNQLELEFIAWANSGFAVAVRATPIVSFEGVWVLSGQLNKRYVGTIRLFGSFFEDSYRRRFVWNVDNRVERTGRIKPNALYNATATGIINWTAAYGNNFLIMDFVVGLGTKARVDALSHAVEVTGARDNQVNIQGVIVPSLFSGLSGTNDPYLYYNGDSHPLWSSGDYWLDPNYYQAYGQFDSVINSGSVNYEDPNTLSAFDGGLILTVLG